MHLKMTTTTSCSAALCKSNENTTVSGRKIKFYSFPTNEKLKQQWDSICKREKDIDQKHRMLCELHFPKNCFNAKNQLKPDATPIIYSKIRAEKVSLEPNNESTKKRKLEQSSSSTVQSIVNLNNSTTISNHKVLQEISKPYRLTIQIDKVNLRPCPLSKKNNQMKTDGTSPEIVKNIYECVVCEKKFNETSELLSHIKKHFTCDICDAEFGSKATYEQHCKQHQSTIKAYPYRCHVCKLVFASKEGVKKHSHEKFEHWSKNEIHCCELCNITFRNEHTYKKHIELHGEKSTLDSVDQEIHLKPFSGRVQLFVCGICQKSFGSIVGINQHMETHELFSKP